MADYLLPEAELSTDNKRQLFSMRAEMNEIPSIIEKKSLFFRMFGRTNTCTFTKMQKNKQEK